MPKLLTEVHWGLFYEPQCKQKLCWL